MASITRALVSSIVIKLRDLLSQEVPSLAEVREQVEWIENQFRDLQLFLTDAETKSDKDPRVKNWMQEVQNVTYLAEDFIDDTFSLETMGQDASGTFARIDVRQRLDSEIKELRGEIRSISESLVACGLEVIGQEDATSTCSTGGDQRLLLSSSVYVDRKGTEEDFVGFHQHREILMQQLMPMYMGNESAQSSGTVGQRQSMRRSVISIVGTEGQGKTSLARKLYESDVVRNYFAAVAWISVNAHGNMRHFLRDIVEQVMEIPKEVSANLYTYVLWQKLLEFLRKRRYLIVFDDVPEMDVHDRLCAALPDAENGSRIIWTTRSKAVAMHADSSNSPYELPLLTMEESWRLFLQKAFPSWLAGEITCPDPDADHLEETGKQIVAKCKGLPLAVVVTGGLIAARSRTRGEGNVADWKHVLRALNKRLLPKTVGSSDMLAFCYSDLPDYLKPCFLYLGLFPKGRTIDVEKLMMLWAAERLIQPRGEHTMEDVAKSYFLELIDRNMIQVADWEWDGVVLTCSIHNLLHDLAVSEATVSVAAEPHLFKSDFQVSYSTSFDKSILAIHSVPATDSLTSIGSLHSILPFIQSRRLRSVLFFTQSPAVLISPWRNCELLRVLDLEGVQLSSNVLDLFITASVHLKYLNLRDTSIKSLPPSIGELYALETLFLDYDTRLPEAIWKLHRLRHLHALDCEFEGQPRVENLKTLQTLCFAAGDWIEENSLSSLSGLLILKVAGDVCAYSRDLWSSISKLKNLHSLVLSESFIARAQIFPSLVHHLYLHEMVLAVPLEKLPKPNEFPPNLTKLVLDRSGLEEDPMPTLEKLENLQILQLSSNVYRGQKMISSAHGFPQLLRLTCLCLDQLVEWVVEEGAMPKLVHLSISVCPKLNVLPEEFETWDISIKLYDRLQEGKGEDWDKIQHISRLVIRK